MNQQELEFTLQKGEGYQTEFKESLKNLDRELVAFANASGGRVFLGIGDDNEVKGVTVDNKLKSQVQDIARNCDPSVDVKIEELENLLIINVLEGKDKPYKCKEGFFLRQGANSQKLTRDEIFDFAIKEGRVKFDTQLNKKFKFPQDFDEEKLDEYLKLVNLKKNIAVKDILLNLSVAEECEGKLLFNNAGILFFAKKPSNFLLSSPVVCVNYQTNRKLNILDRKIFDNGFIKNLQDALHYVEKHIDVEFVIDSIKRKEIPQYPKEAFRECIVNAMMHRDYFDTAEDVLIEIFRNKIAISNPGGLVQGLTPEQFGKKTRSRNRIITNLLLRTIFVEKLGTGINRIREAINKMQLPVPMFEFDSSFQVTLFDKKGVQVGLVDGLVDGLVETQKKIIGLISKNKQVSKQELAKNICVSTTAIDKNILQLKKKGLLKRIGPAKGGYWEIINE